MVNVVLRIRTNLGVKRLTIDNNASIAQLVDEVSRLFNVITAFPLVLAIDIEGNRPLDYDSLLPRYNITNGDEIFVLGRFENMRIEKTTINDQHEVIKADDYFELVEPPNVGQPVSSNRSTSEGKLSAKNTEANNSSY
ncbi:hypothetical protein EON65_37255, partial [archaeon]